MEKKYEFTNETQYFYGHILHRIRALKDFCHVKAGDLGGWVESKRNLSQEGTCWVGKEAIVCGEAKVYGKAIVCGEAEVYGKAIVRGEAIVCGKALVHGETKVYDKAMVCGEAEVFGRAKVFGETKVYSRAKVCGEAQVYGKALVHGEALVYDKAEIFGEAKVCGEAQVYGKALVHGEAQVYDKAEIFGEANVRGEAKIYGKASIYQGTITSTDDYICIGPIGSRNDFTTFFKDGDKIMVKCGCFRGDIEEFEKKVTETHKSNTRYLKQYRGAVYAAKLSIL